MIIAAADLGTVAQVLAIIGAACAVAAMLVLAFRGPEQ